MRPGSDKMRAETRGDTRESAGRRATAGMKIRFLYAVNRICRNRERLFITNNTPRFRAKIENNDLVIDQKYDGEEVDYPGKNIAMNKKWSVYIALAVVSISLFCSFIVNDNDKNEKRSPALIKSFDSNNNEHPKIVNIVNFIRLLGTKGFRYYGRCTVPNRGKAGRNDEEI